MTDLPPPIPMQTDPSPAPPEEYHQPAQRKGLIVTAIAVAAALALGAGGWFVYDAQVSTVADMRNAVGALDAPTDDAAAALEDPAVAEFHASGVFNSSSWAALLAVTDAGQLRERLTRVDEMASRAGSVWLPGLHGEAQALLGDFIRGEGHGVGDAEFLQVLAHSRAACESGDPTAYVEGWTPDLEPKPRRYSTALGNGTTVEGGSVTAVFAAFPTAIQAGTTYLCPDLAGPPTDTDAPEVIVLPDTPAEAVAPEQVPAPETDMIPGEGDTENG